MSSCRRLAKFFTPRRRRRRGKCTHADNVGVQLDCVCVHAGLPCRSPSSGLPLETAPQLLAPVMAGRSLPLDTCLVVSFIFLPCCFCCFFSCFAAAFAVFFFCSLCCCFLLLICCCAIAPFVAGTVAADAAAVASVTASYCSNNRDSAALADAAVAAAGLATVATFATAATHAAVFAIVAAAASAVAVPAVAALGAPANAPAAVIAVPTLCTRMCFGVYLRCCGCKFCRSVYLTLYLSR